MKTLVVYRSHYGRVHAGMLNGWHRRWMPMLRRKGRRTRALCRTMNA